MTELEKCKQRLLKHYRHVVAESEQALRDIAWWNDNRTECEPMDPEPWRVMLHCAKRILAQIESNQQISEDLYQRLLSAAGE